MQRSWVDQVKSICGSLSAPLLSSTEDEDTGSIRSYYTYGHSCPSHCDPSVNDPLRLLLLLERRSISNQSWDSNPRIESGQRGKVWMKYIVGREL